MDKELARDEPRVGVRQGQSRELLDLVANLMARIGSDEALDSVLKLAHAKSVGGSGVRVLGSFKQERAVKELRGFLENPDEGLRCLAAFALADRKDPAAIEVLVGLATNPKRSWRGMACLALVKFPNDPRVEPAIKSCLDDRESGGEA